MHASHRLPCRNSASMDIASLRYEGKARDHTIVKASGEEEGGKATRYRDSIDGITFKTIRIIW